MKNLTTILIFSVIAIFFGAALYFFAVTSELLLTCKACDPYLQANQGITIIDKFYNNLLATFLLVYHIVGENFKVSSNFDINATIGIFVFLFAFFFLSYLLTLLLKKFLS